MAAHGSLAPIDSIGHSGVMSLTEKVYTHPDIKELLDAINKI